MTIPPFTGGPVTFRIKFKILIFVFKALQGLAPQYLAELLSCYNPPWGLRSVVQLLLEVPRSWKKSSPHTSGQCNVTEIG